MNDAARCVNHGHHASKSCINCHLPLCDGCHRFDINSRPWCYGCGSEKVPGTGDAFRNLSKTLIKAFAVIFAGLMVLSLVRGIYGFIGAIVLMTVVAKFLFVRDQIPDARIEEYRDGICVRS